MGLKFGKAVTMIVERYGWSAFDNLNAINDPDLCKAVEMVRKVRKYGLSERYWFAHGMYNLIKSDPYRKLVEQKKAELKSLINQGATDAAIGAELGMTVSRVKYWIKEWNLGRRKHIIATGRFR